MPVDKSFGTIILERIVDLFCMLGFLALTLIFKYNAILAFYHKSGIKINPVYIFFGFVILVVGIFIFFKFKDKFTHIPFLGKIIEFVEGIFHGLTTIFKLKQKVKFIILSVAIWVSYYLAAYLVCFSLPAVSYTHLDVYKRQELHSQARFLLHIPVVLFLFPAHPVAGIVRWQFFHQAGWVLSATGRQLRLIFSIYCRE